jgi:hypothetical protein
LSRWSCPSLCSMLRCSINFGILSVTKDICSCSYRIATYMKTLQSIQV